MWAEDDGGNLQGGSGEGETTQTTEAKPTQVTLDPSAFDKFGEVIARQFKSQDDSRQQQNRQPTPEERAAARKQFGMVDIDDTTLAELDNLETRKGAWQKTIDRIYESQHNITAAMLAAQNKAWEERFAPVNQYFTQTQEDARVSRFHKGYPQLSDENLAPVISGVGQKLAEQGAFKNLTESQAFDVLAKGVESVIKHHNPSFSLTKNNTKSSNEIPVEGNGSRGGGGNSGGAKAPSQAASILGLIPSKR